MENQAEKQLNRLEMEISGERSLSGSGYRLSRFGVCALATLALCAMVMAALLGSHLSGTSRQRTDQTCSGNQSDLEMVPNDHSTEKRAAVRLPLSPRPLHYQLSIHPNLDAERLNYTGNVTVLLWSSETTDQLLLNSLQLQINKVRVIRVPDSAPAWFEAGAEHAQPLRLDQLKQLEQLKVLETKIDLQAETLQLKMNSSLQPKRAYLLNIDFIGNITNLLSGFYRSTYVDSNSGKTNYIGMTQFQATDARRAFPCWDEPAFKATFDISIIHWRNHTALSNMPTQKVEPVLSSNNESEWIRSDFRRTLRMSTYLLAWAVGDLKSLSSPDSRFSIWSRPAVIQSARHALQLGPEVLRFYEKFFGIAYPLPKTDMLAAPDFNAGAMENWGLVTYRETLLLYEPQVSRPLDLYGISSVVAHELAHQWFGNLVTMRWWDDLWLNEGFATYMSYEALEGLYPQWQVMHDLQVSEVQSVLRLDCLHSSHPISVSVGHPDEISEIFDHISYSKGASIIRMMVHFLGREQFRAGVSAYLRALAYSSSQQDDLWRYLSAAADGSMSVPEVPVVPVISKVSNNNNLTDELPYLEPGFVSNEKLLRSNVVEQDNSRKMDVKRVMDSWTLKAGYPLITVNRDYKSNSATFRQKRFLLERPENDSYDGELWEVPITYTNANERNWQPTTRLWLHKTDIENDSDSKYIVPNIASENDWLLVNLKQVGFYRVNYDLRNWKLLMNQLRRNHTVIHEQSRAQLLNDLFALAEAGELPYELALQTCLDYLPVEQSPLVWRTALGGLSQVGGHLQRSLLFGRWSEYMRRILTPLYEKLSFDQPDNQRLQESELQAVGLQVACRYHVKGCVEKARKLFQTYRTAVENSKNASASFDLNSTTATSRNATAVNNLALNPIPPNVRSTVYCVGVQQGDENDWEFIWKEYQQADVASERNRLLHSLKCSRVPWLLVRLLHSSFAEGGSIKKQDGISVFRSIASQNHARDIAFNFLRQHWSKILARYGKSFFSFGRLVSSISGVNSQFELQQMLEFHRSLREQVGSAERAFQQAIESIQANVRWMNQFYPQVETFLVKHFGPLSY